jgi:hypothetical protein
MEFLKRRTGQNNIEYKSLVQLHRPHKSSVMVFIRKVDVHRIVFIYSESKFKFLRPYIEDCILKSSLTIDGHRYLNC